MTWWTRLTGRRHLETQLDAELRDHILAKLNADERAILLAKYCDDKSEAELAEQFGLSPTAARSRLREATDHYARMMGKPECWN